MQACPGRAAALTVLSAMLLTGTSPAHAEINGDAHLKSWRRYTINLGTGQGCSGAQVGEVHVQGSVETVETITVDGSPVERQLRNPGHLEYWRLQEGQHGQIDSCGLVLTYVEQLAETAFWASRPCSSGDQCWLVSGALQPEIAPTSLASTLDQGRLLHGPTSTASPDPKFYVRFRYLNPGATRAEAIQWLGVGADVLDRVLFKDLTCEAGGSTQDCSETGSSIVLSPQTSGYSLQQGTACSYKEDLLQ